MPDSFSFFFSHQTSRFVARELGATGPWACVLTRPASCLRATPLRSVSGGDAKSSIRPDSREESTKEKKERAGREGEEACRRLQNKCVPSYQQRKSNCLMRGKKENIIPLLITNMCVCYLLRKHLLRDVSLLLHFGFDQGGELKRP